MTEHHTTSTRSNRSSTPPSSKCGNGGSCTSISMTKTSWSPKTATFTSLTLAYRQKPTRPRISPKTFPWTTTPRICGRRSSKSTGTRALFSIIRRQTQCGTTPTGNYCNTSKRSRTHTRAYTPTVANNPSQTVCNNAFFVTPKDVQQQAGRGTPPVLESGRSNFETEPGDGGNEKHRVAHPAPTLLQEQARTAGKHRTGGHDDAAGREPQHRLNHRGGFRDHRVRIRFREVSVIDDVWRAYAKDFSL